ncbi:MAG TPA: hypothetical protein VGK44_15945 [Casimicrobiaceae bacterium]|jgi:hypothetical protein
MKQVSIKAVLAAGMFGALLLGGCATTLDMGPGYYHYDTGLAYRTAPAVVTTAPAVVTTSPTVVYREPSLVYHEPTVIYRSEPVF